MEFLMFLLGVFLFLWRLFLLVVPSIIAIVAMVLSHSFFGFFGVVLFFFIITLLGGLALNYEEFSKAGLKFLEKRRKK
ncbi:MAG: hypothetical protein ACRC0G_09285 [Fusobacteriaceae bacterium]